MMTTYLVRRLSEIPVVIILITMLLFFLVRVTGDPVELMLGDDAELADIERMRERLGLDRPLHIQYLFFLRDAVQGRFGRSYRYPHEAMTLVMERFPVTILLGSCAVAIAVIISLPAGIIAALKRNTIPDYIATSFAVLGQAMPNFWLGIMLILIVSVLLGWLPPSGYRGARYLILPAITLGTARAAVLTRLMRSSLLEVIREDYISTARSKGLSERVVVYKHALRNAFIPYVTVLGLQVALIMSGSLITEQVFAYPGMGRLAIGAINARDMSVVQAFVFVVALTVMVANLVVDLLYSVIDPRIRYS